MTEQKKESLIASIEDSARIIETEIGYETVTFVLLKYGADCIEEIYSGDLWDVFNEMDAIAADLRYGNE